jgi:hypothetical protein
MSLSFRDFGETIETWSAAVIRPFETFDAGGPRSQTHAINMEFSSRRLTQPLFTPAVEQLARWGISGAVPAWLGLAAGLGGATCIAMQADLGGLAAFGLAQVLLALSAQMSPSNSGRAFELHQAFSPITMAGVPFAFALADPGHAMSASFFLLGACVELAASPRECGHHTGKLVRLSHDGFAAVAILCCLWVCAMPSWFGLVSYLVGILGFLAAGGGIAGVMTDAGS